MFASKTTKLLAQIERESYRNKEDAIVLIKSAIDARHGSQVVGTHRGIVRYATVSTDALMPLELGAHVRVVCVDEGQFFPDVAEAALRWSDEGRHVYVSCLDLDSARRPWDSVARLLCVATHVDKSQAVCECGEDAIYSHKKSRDSARVLVGDEKEYTSLCALCYIEQVNK